MRALIHQYYTAHPVVFTLVAFFAASWIVSVFWSRLRTAFWPGVDTAKLPAGAKLAEVFVALISDVARAVRTIVTALASMRKVGAGDVLAVLPVIPAQPALTSPQGTEAPRAPEPETQKP